MSIEVTPTSEAVGMELRSHSMMAVRVDAAGSILASSQSAFDPDVESVPQLIEFVGKVESETGPFNEFGLAVPGLVDILGNKVVYSSQFPEQEKTDLAGQIASATEKRVYLENDANAAAFGELMAGAAHDAKDFFYVMTGTGIGGALVVDGKVWHGVSGYAGEFGFVAINSEGRRLEDMAAADGVVRRAKNRLHQDPASSLFEIGEENIKFNDIINAANKGDGLAELILERTGMFLGTALAGVINLLNIEKVIVGGELMNAGELVLDAIKNRASELAFEPAFSAVSIEAGSLKAKASSVGAALLVLNRQIQ